jgi:hypothetical protein
MPTECPQVFLLSPANLSGIRGQYLLGPKANSEMANRLRSGGVPIGELFTYVSSLYFRGKLAYALAFAAPPPLLSGSFVITATGDLLAPDTVVTLDRLREMADCDIHVGNERYRSALDRACHNLARNAGNSCAAVLLGSIATPKYVQSLLQAFGERLLFPSAFVGRGDMSRGGLLLRSVAAGEQLVYTPVAGANRHGPRPPKLSRLLGKSRRRQPA